MSTEASAIDRPGLPNASGISATNLGLRIDGPFWIAAFLIDLAAIFRLAFGTKRANATGSR
jgi:hypothetical protein